MKTPTFPTCFRIYHRLSFGSFLISFLSVLSAEVGPETVSNFGIIENVDFDSPPPSLSEKISHSPTFQSKITREQSQQLAPSKQVFVQSVPPVFAQTPIASPTLAQVVPQPQVAPALQPVRPVAPVQAVPQAQPQYQYPVASPTPPPAPPVVPPNPPANTSTYGMKLDPNDKIGV